MCVVAHELTYINVKKEKENRCTQEQCGTQEAVAGRSTRWRDTASKKAGMSFGGRKGLVKGDR